MYLVTQELTWWLHVGQKFGVIHDLPLPWTRPPHQLVSLVTFSNLVVTFDPHIYQCSYGYAFASCLCRIAFYE